MAKPFKAWSFSSFNVYRQCPKLFRHRYIEGHKQGSTPALERGNRVHAGLEKYIKGEDAELPGEVKFNAWHRHLYEWMRSHPHKILEQQWGYNIAWRPTGWFAKDTWFRSKLDVLLQYSDATGEVVDHKTGKISGDYEAQMELFAISTFARFQTVTDVHTRLIYVDQGEEREDDFSRKSFEKLKQKWDDAVRPMFMEVDYNPRPNEKCRFCELAASNGGDCRYG